MSPNVRKNITTKWMKCFPFIMMVISRMRTNPILVTRMLYLSILSVEKSWKSGLSIRFYCFWSCFVSAYLLFPASFYILILHNPIHDQTQHKFITPKFMMESR